MNNEAVKISKKRKEKLMNLQFEFNLITFINKIIKK